MATLKMVRANSGKTKYTKEVLQQTDQVQSNHTATNILTRNNGLNPEFEIPSEQCPGSGKGLLSNVDSLTPSLC